MALYQEQLKKLVEVINDVDAIVVGAGSGMSAADGKAYWYQADDNFMKKFGDFHKKYGFKGAFNGVYHPYKSRSERWAYVVRMETVMYEDTPGQAYIDLMELVKQKEYHILTTNLDMLFYSVAPEDKISAIQGDNRYFQCGRGCHDALYPAVEKIKEMNAAMTPDLKVPEEMIPKCPKCGHDMEPWGRNPYFLEGKRYRHEYKKLNDFIEKVLNKKVLFLELGVGRMTPMFIQEPFWNLTYNLPNTYYVSINPKDAILPKELKDKGMTIREDIAAVLHDVREKTGV